jgi:hypothetical protein
MKEQSHYNRLCAAHATQGRIFRNNTGAVVTQDGRLVTFGLCKGSSDLIGWTEVEITPEMVGQKLAVFTAVEVKKKGKKPTKEQKQFIKIVSDAGGIAKVEEV